MVSVPQSTVERPLTAIDYCAVLAQCNSIDEVHQYAERCPLEVRQDDRFARSVAHRLGEIKARRKSA